MPDPGDTAAGDRGQGTSSSSGLGGGNKSAGTGARGPTGPSGQARSSPAGNAGGAPGASSRTGGGAGTGQGGQNSGVGRDSTRGLGQGAGGAAIGKGGAGTGQGGQGAGAGMGGFTSVGQVNARNPGQAAPTKSTGMGGQNDLGIAGVPGAVNRGGGALATARGPATTGGQPNPTGNTNQYQSRGTVLNTLDGPSALRDTMAVRSLTNAERLAENNLRNAFNSNVSGMTFNGTPQQQQGALPQASYDPLSSVKAPQAPAYDPLSSVKTPYRGTVAQQLGRATVEAGQVIGDYARDTWNSITSGQPNPTSVGLGPYGGIPAAPLSGPPKASAGPGGPFGAPAYNGSYNPETASYGFDSPPAATPGAGPANPFSNAGMTYSNPMDLSRANMQQTLENYQQQKAAVTGAIQRGADIASDVPAPMSFGPGMQYGNPAPPSGFGYDDSVGVGYYDGALTQGMQPYTTGNLAIQNAMNTPNPSTMYGAEESLLNTGVDSAWNRTTNIANMPNVGTVPNKYAAPIGPARPSSPSLGYSFDPSSELQRSAIDRGLSESVIAGELSGGYTPADDDYVGTYPGADTPTGEDIGGVFGDEEKILSVENVPEWGDVYNPADYENSLAIRTPSWKQSTYTGPMTPASDVVAEPAANRDWASITNEVEQNVSPSQQTQLIDTSSIPYKVIDNGMRVLDMTGVPIGTAARKAIGFDVNRINQMTPEEQRALVDRWNAEQDAYMRGEGGGQDRSLSKSLAEQLYGGSGGGSYIADTPDVVDPGTEEDPDADVFVPPTVVSPLARQYLGPTDPYNYGFGGEYSYYDYT